MRLRVLLADDHKIFLAGLRSLLQPRFDVVGCAEDGRALLAAAATLQPDVVVADVSMPVLNGFEAAAQLKKTVPGVKIVFLSMHTDSIFVTQARQVGANGFVAKTAAPSDLMAVIGQVAGGGPFACSLAREEANTLPRADALTPRQRQVLQLLAEGHGTKEIAVALSISTKTVEFHKYTIMERLGVRTIAGLTKYAVRHGFAEL
jgi:DNA-binding NarL/FixJ family response regulator